MAARSVFRFALIFALLAGVILIWHQNALEISEFIQFEVSKEEQLEYRLQGPIDPVDQDLLQLVSEKFLIPPSTKPYDLKLHKNTISALNYNTFYKGDISFGETRKKIKNLFPTGTENRGFFVEAGAFDGEMNSHSLYLELELGWTGLLVEPSRDSFQQLQSKNRKAWLCNCCLSPKPFPTQEFLSKIQGDNHYAQLMNTISKNSDSVVRSRYGYVSYEKTQCFPLHTLLKAINQTRVDLFVLDTEDSELPILKNFPFSEIDVTIWIIEHRSSSNVLMMKDTEDKDFIDWFSSLGYYLYVVGKAIPRNYYFIKRNSTFYRKNRRRLNLE